MLRLSIRSSACAVAVFTAFAAPTFAESLTVSNWDGYMAADAMDSFNAASGNEAELVLHATNEEIMGKLIASKGVGYDVVFVSSPFAEVLNNLGLAETLDHAKIPNIANLFNEATLLPHDPGNTFSLPYAWGTTGLCYRSDLVDEPTSWGDLLMPAGDVSGKTTMLATDRWLLAAGQLQLGYSVNETDPAKMAKVRDLLIEAKKPCLLMTIQLSTLNWCLAKLNWCKHGMAGATMVSVKTRISNTQFQPKVLIFGSTQWLS